MASQCLNHVTLKRTDETPMLIFPKDDFSQNLLSYSSLSDSPSLSISLSLLYMNVFPCFLLVSLYTINLSENRGQK